MGLLFCLMYILYIYNELRKIADVGSQMGERRFCSPMNGVADKQWLQLASCLTDGHCRHAQGLKESGKVSTFHFLVGSYVRGKHKKQHVCGRKRWSIFFNIFLEAYFFRHTA